MSRSSDDALALTSVRLPDRQGLWTVEIAAGRIACLSPTSDRPAQLQPGDLDAQGRLLIPGLVDGHLHLDKALLLDRTPAVAGTFAEAMDQTLAAKREFTYGDIQSRARQVIERAIGLGTTAMRSHVEVDPVVGLLGVEALLPLKQQYAWGLTLQLAVFAQEGITNHPGEVDLLRQALQKGGDVIGSAPYVDPDPQDNIRILFDLAEEFDLPVDFHLDFLDDDRPLLLPQVIEETQRRGWQGRVCLGHMTKLAGVDPEQLQDWAMGMRESGISILALPASDLYMMARKDTHNQRRGVAPIHHLADWGVTVGVATNNILNLFTPFGDGDVLKIGMLLAQVLQMGTQQAQTLCLEMITSRAAQAIGIGEYGLQPGRVADLVLLEAHSVSEAIGAAPLGRTVIKAGRIVAQTQIHRQLCPPPPWPNP